jgi:hypothetical protein
MNSHFLNEYSFSAFCNSNTIAGAVTIVAQNARVSGGARGPPLPVHEELQYDRRLH